MPCSNHFLRQWQTVGLETPSRRAIAVFTSPSAEARMICARHTKPCDAECERVMRSNSSSSPALSTSLRCCGRPICAMIPAPHGRIIHRFHCYVNFIMGQNTRWSALESPWSSSWVGEA
jgi:hypothetical protein